MFSYLAVSLSSQVKVQRQIQLSQQTTLQQQRDCTPFYIVISNKSLLNKQFVTSIVPPTVMLLQKKHKQQEDKPNKKYKKNKNTSPTKLKVTPEKPHRKDQNTTSQHNHCYSQTQPLDLHKLKSRQAPRQSQTKKTAIQEARSKLLTTSPVLFDHSKSHSRKKSKGKSKQRSTLKINTNRQTHKQKDLIKNVSKRLYTQVKEDKNKSNSKSKSKSKSRCLSRTKGKDVSPLKQTKRFKEFNVADREITYKKAQVQEQKKSIKKKIRNKMKGEQLQKYPKTDRPNYQPQKEESKMKLKKKVPQIKTEFSERRGSYFDQNLLKKLQLGQSEFKKIENSPFVHIKSNFEMKFQNGNAEVTSRSQFKTYDDPVSESVSKQLQNFKKDQQLRWNRLLFELQNLKNQQKVPQKIDQLIKQLNDNYCSLQRVTDLQKSAFERSKEEENSVVVKETEQEDQLRQNLLEVIHIDRVSQQIEKIDNNNRDQVLPTVQEPKVQDIKTEEMQPKQIPLIDKLTELSQKNEDLMTKSEHKGDEIQELKPSTSDEIQGDGNKLNAIHLDNQFYDCFSSSKKKLKLQLLSNSPALEHPSTQNITSDLINETEEHKESDKNLLMELDFLDGPSKLVEVVAVSQSAKSEFEQEMQNIRQIQSEQFGNMVCLDFVPGFDHEMKMPEQMSSESILLRSYDCLQLKQNDPKISKIIDEVQHVLVLQFCTTILRNKQILHNFMNTYSQLVKANVINDQLFLDTGRPLLECSNEYVMKVILLLFDYLQVNKKEELMKQIKIPFQCKPLDILKLLRYEEDLPYSLIGEDSNSNDHDQLIVPFFRLEDIQDFESKVLKNEYYIPNYFSFNHSIYDLFNDALDELRPFGNKGRSIFSISLSHPITVFKEFKSKTIKKVENVLNQPFYEQKIDDFSQDYKDEGLFQLIYYTCNDIIEQFFQVQVLLIYQLMMTKQQKQFTLF